MHRNEWRFYNLTWEGRAIGLTLLDVMKNEQEVGACCAGSACLVRAGVSDPRRALLDDPVCGAMVVHRSDRAAVVVADGGTVLAVMAIHDGRRTTFDDVHVVWALARFFGVRGTIGQWVRGVILDSKGADAPVRRDSISRSTAISA